MTIFLRCTFVLLACIIDLQLNIGVSRERRENWLNDPPATSESNGATNHDDRDVIKERCRGRTFFLIIRGIFYFMKTTKLRICLREGNLAGATEHDIFKYFATAIEYKGRYYYQVFGEVLQITRLEHDRIITNPYLYYFSTALKMHLRIQKQVAVNNTLHT